MIIRLARRREFTKLQGDDLRSDLSRPLKQRNFPGCKPMRTSKVRAHHANFAMLCIHYGALKEHAIRHQFDFR
jgi:hypothetical protein